LNLGPENLLIAPAVLFLLGVLTFLLHQVRSPGIQLESSVSKSFCSRFLSVFFLLSPFVNLSSLWFQLIPRKIFFFSSLFPPFCGFLPYIPFLSIRHRVFAPPPEPLFFGCLHAPQNEQMGRVAGYLPPLFIRARRQILSPFLMIFLWIRRRQFPPPSLAQVLPLPQQFVAHVPREFFPGEFLHLPSLFNSRYFPIQLFWFFEFLLCFPTSPGTSELLNRQGQALCPGPFSVFGAGQCFLNKPELPGPAS